MKILQVGSDSPHFTSFINAVYTLLNHIVILSEQHVQFSHEFASCIVNFRKLNPFSLANNYFQLKEFIKTNTPDVVHIHQANRLAFFTVMACRSLNIPVITTTWGSDVLLEPKKSPLHKKIATYILKNSHAITADADVMIAEMLKLESNSNKYHKIQYGIDKIKATEKRKVIYSNRLHNPLYNIETVIYDFIEFNKSNPDWRLIIAGEGSETIQLKEIVNNLSCKNSIEFVGWLKKNENEKYYEEASIYVSVPSSDGTSVSLLEAMSANCIPVVSDLPVNREWISHMQNGVLRDGKQNPFELALKIDTAKCIAINQKLIDENAWRENTIKKFLELYKAIM